MKVVVGVPTTDAMLSDLSIAEPDAASGEAAWNSATTYITGQQAVNAAVHRTYQSLQDGNLNHALPTWPATSNDWWIDVGPTNRWKMFDYVADTQAEGASPLTVTVTPGKRVNSILFDAVVADSVTIEGVSAGETVYGPVTKILRTRNVRGWYDYFYAPFDASNAGGVFNIPPRTDIALSLTFTRATGNAKVGDVLVGNAYDIGTAQFPLQKPLQNYSLINIDAFGNASFVPRPSKSVLSHTVLAPASSWKTIEDLRTQLKATPAGWTTLTETNVLFPQFTVIGFYTRWDMQLSKARQIEQTLEVRQF
jgi:hypothetical protein